jgi:hypothetical protein
MTALKRWCDVYSERSTCPRQTVKKLGVHNRVEEVFCPVHRQCSLNMSGNSQQHPVDLIVANLQVTSYGGACVDVTQFSTTPREEKLEE